jgi:DNA-binding NtrC family response regulator
VLESGEFIKVGASKVLKTDVRVVAATNVNIPQAIEKNKFREDLYYRLNTVPIAVPPLRERKQDIFLLMRKFAADFAAKYRMPVIKLTPDAEQVLVSYYWQGNVRQLKNITEQISVIERKREIDAETLVRYLPDMPSSSSNLPMVLKGEHTGSDFSERDLLYKVLFDMRSELADLKQLVLDLIENGGGLSDRDAALVEKLYRPAEGAGWVMPRQLESGAGGAGGVGAKGAGASSSEAGEVRAAGGSMGGMTPRLPETLIAAEDVEAYEEVLSLQDSERDLIRKALEKHRNRRKYAARELGISERTLYRKIKEYGLA